MISEAGTERVHAPVCPFGGNSAAVADSAAPWAGVSAEAQLESLWCHLVAAELPQGHPVVWPTLRSVQQEATRTGSYASLLRSRSDTRPDCCKNLCAVGMVARAEIEWLGGGGGGAGYRWSGLFGGGASGQGILRLSSAIEPPVAGSTSLPMALRAALRFMAGDLASARLFPCAAFKVPRTNAPSGNLLFAGRKVLRLPVRFFSLSSVCVCVWVCVRVCVCSLYINRLSVCVVCVLVYGSVFLLTRPLCVVA